MTWSEDIPPCPISIGVLLGTKLLLQPITSAQSDKEGFIPSLSSNLGDFGNESKSVLEGTTVLVRSLVGDGR